MHSQYPLSLPVANQEYSLGCRIDGSPYPIVYWRWKPSSCDRNDEDWTNVEENGKSPNREEMRVSFNPDYMLTNLRVTAKQSGFYMCVAFNSMGNNSLVIPFFVSGMHIFNFLLGFIRVNNF